MAYDTDSDSSSKDQSPASKARTASELLAAFSPLPSPKKKPFSTTVSSPVSIIMTAGKRRSTQKAVDYTMSENDSEEDPLSTQGSSFGTPQKDERLPRRGARIATIDADDFIEIERPPTPPPRVSTAGHSLRQHNILNLSLKAMENGDKPRATKAAKRGRGRKKSLQIVKSDLVDVAQTARKQVRDSIATKTTVKRARFFREYKDLFLPLLPEHNYISKSLEAHVGDNDVSGVVPMADIAQPKGITATMKPYQLTGLSFMVWLKQNGLSGILGDEMGLGKTLQTLSLLQHIKENPDDDAADVAFERRPSLVVCPLSVLSSWMSEAKRWVPTMKTLRFHGPSKERERIMRIASGLEDMHGNPTRAILGKLYKKQRKAGKDVTAPEPDAQEEEGVDLIVTTYETFAAEQSWFKMAFVWKYVILDEGHKIKNNLSQISTALQGLGAEYRLILTGTPLQNNLAELWALLHWLYPEVFTAKTSELFKESFDLTKGKVSTSFMDDARRLLELIMLRRMKNSPGVDLNLPPKTEVLLYVPLTPLQRFWYTRLLAKADQGLLEDLFKGASSKEAEAIKEEAQLKNQGSKDLQELEKLQATGNPGADWEESKVIMKQALEREKQEAGTGTAWKKLMNLLMQLRKCCNHPYLLPNAEPDPYYLGEHVIHGSGKFLILDKLIEELVIKKKKKVLIFSGFTRMLDCCEDFLSLRGGNGEKFRYVRLDGGTCRARRNLSIRMFNDRSSEQQVMLISTKAGGLGVNLASASDVIMLDQEWNPQIMLQAEARAHRIGQQNPVTVYKLITQGTVEEQMMGRIQKKLYLSAKVTESMKSFSASPTKTGKKGRPSMGKGEDMPQLDTSQLMTLVRRGAQALSHPDLDIDEMVGWDWPTMLEKCRDKPADAMVAEHTQVKEVCDKDVEEKRWLNQMEQVESRIFQGKKWMKEQERKGVSNIISATRQDRRIGKNTTVMVGGFAISKESMTCGDWEAVPTMAGKDPRLAEVKREKRTAIVNQDYCQVCQGGGEIHLCSGCPRSYHYQCLDKDFKKLSRGNMQFYCPQHQCADCTQKTGDAGGMIYRCRWCERGYCEDCADFDTTELLGDTLKEYLVLGFGAIDQAFYIKCANCVKEHSENLDSKAACDTLAEEADDAFEQMMTTAANEELMGITAATTPAPTTTEGTLVASGTVTPKEEEDTGDSPTSRKRTRKRKSEGLPGGVTELPITPKKQRRSNHLVETESAFS
ncbi:hypothetical protein MMC25_007822 [Agyrium rufum]|nr:hypothetical protein [Agyrium rufum]